MIKVEIMEEENGVRRIIFECQNDSEKDDLDKVLEALVGPFPRRGVFLTSNTLDVQIKVK
jgi:hypothetical protein